MLDHEELLAGMSHPEALAVLTRCDLSALSSSRGRGRQELAAIPPSRSSCAAIVGARHPDDPDPGHRDAALAALRSRL